MDTIPPQTPPKKRRKSITPEDVDAICRLTARGMTEKQSVAKLGINETQWWTWKTRHKDKFEKAFTRIKANRIDNMLANMEAHANGDEARNIRSDWRCSAALLAFTAPDQFGTKQQDVQAAPTLQITISQELAKSIFAPLIGQPAPKLIEAEVISKDEKPLLG